MAEEKLTSRHMQAIKMRAKLQSIVADMAHDKTLDNIRIKDICKAADISLGNYYQYFPSKEAAMICSYEYIDNVWRELELEKIRDPLERAYAIVDAHLGSFKGESLCFITQLYIAQLKIYQDYFFTEDRYLHKTMTDAILEGQREGIFTNSYEARELTLKILNFSRGLVYNYCIRHREEQEKWFEFAKHEQREYMSLFITNRQED